MKYFEYEFSNMGYTSVSNFLFLTIVMFTTLFSIDTSSSTVAGFIGPYINTTAILAVVIIIYFFLLCTHVLISTQKYGGLTVHRYPRIVELSLLIISSLYIIKLYLGNIHSLTNAVSSPARIMILYVNFAIIPLLIKKDFLFKIISRMAIVFMMIPVLFSPLLLIDSTLFFELFWSTSRDSRLPPAENRYRLNSIVGNPRFLSKMLFLGIISTLAVYKKNNHRREVYITIVLAIGVYLTQSRATMIGLATVAGIFIIYKYSTKDFTKFTILLTISGVVVSNFVLILLSYFQPRWFISTSRTILWQATTEAIIQRPLLGYEFGLWGGEHIETYLPEQSSVTQPHNSILTMSLYTGLLGGIAYVTLITSSIILYLYRSQMDILLVLLAIGVFIDGLFSASYPLGYSIDTVILFWVIGYMMYDMGVLNEDLTDIPRA